MITRDDDGEFVIVERTLMQLKVRTSHITYHTSHVGFRLLLLFLFLLFFHVIDGLFRPMGPSRDCYFFLRNSPFYLGIAHTIINPYHNH